MLQDTTNLNEAFQILERTPATLRSMLDGLSDTWIRATEGDNTWSPHNVIAHLIHCDRVDWISRMRRILSGENKEFDSIDREGEFAENNAKPLNELLNTFAEIREQNIQTVRDMNLSAVDLEKTGIHPVFGVVTLGQLIATWTVHDLDHLTQIARTMAKVYTDATGPWIAYLSVLRDRTIRPPSPD